MESQGLLHKINARGQYGWQSGIVWPVRTLKVRPELDEEGHRLLASLNDCHAKQLDAAYQLSHPPTIMVYSEYVKAVDALAAVRLKCHGILQRLRAHRKNRQDR